MVDFKYGVTTKLFLSKLMHWVIVLELKLILNCLFIEYILWKQKLRISCIKKFNEPSVRIVNYPIITHDDDKLDFQKQ